MSWWKKSFYHSEKANSKVHITRLVHNKDFFDKGTQITETKRYSYKILLAFLTMTRSNIQLVNRVSVRFPACVRDFPVCIKHMKPSDCMDPKINLNHTLLINTNLTYFMYACYLMFKFTVHVSAFATLYLFSRSKREALKLKAPVKIVRQKTFFNKNQSGNCFDWIQSTKKETKGSSCFD